MGRDSILATLDPRQPPVAAAIHRVMMEAYEVEAALLGVADFVPLHRGTDEIRDADSTYLGAFVAAELAAVAELETPPQGPVNVASLVVLPRHFRQGLATVLLRHVIEEHGRRGVTVSTGAANEPALGLYAKLGFAEHRRWRTADGIPMVTLLRPG